MKTATVIWREQLDKEKVPYWQVNDVHDEWQTETLDDEDLANHVEQVQIDSIRIAGEVLGITCPLLGTGKQGYNWRDTH